MQTFDIIISLGKVCRPAYQLKVNGLRDKAYPLDWQMDYSLDTVEHLFATGFEDFFTDIVEEESSSLNENRRIKDVKNGIISLHHFSKSIGLSDYILISIKNYSVATKIKTELLSKGYKNSALLEEALDSMFIFENYHECEMYKNI